VSSPDEHDIFTLRPIRLLPAALARGGAFALGGQHRVAAADRVRGDLLQRMIKCTRALDRISRQQHAAAGGTGAAEDLEESLESARLALAKEREALESIFYRARYWTVKVISACTFMLFSSAAFMH
jgi:hypothetical protein